MLKIDKILSGKLNALSLLSTFFVLVLHAGGQVEMALQKDRLSLFVSDVLSNGICSGAVPMFYLVSGFLWSKNIDLRCRGWIGSLQKRLYTLVVPYVCWNVLACIYWHFVHGFPWPSFGEIFGLSCYFPAHHALWYVKWLLVFFVLSPLPIVVIRFCSGRAFAERMLFAVCVGAVCFTKSVTCFGLICCTLGLWLGFGYERYVALSHQAIKRLAGIACVCLALFLTARVLHTTISGHDPRFLWFPMILAMLATFWLGFDALEIRGVRGGLLKRMSSVTFFVYCFHFVVLDHVNAFTFCHLHQVVATIVGVICAAAVSFPLAMVLQRYCKGLFSVLTGGRG